MSSYKIALGVRQPPGTKDASSPTRGPSKEQSENVIARDGYACRCCGFVSKKYQRAITVPESLDKDGRLELSDFITVCPFCEHCFSLEKAGLMGAGSLIWLPEISQADLNQLAKALYVAMAEDGDMAVLAKRVLENLKNRRIEAKKRLGTDDPLILATAMKEELTPNEYAAVSSKMEGLRLLPLDRYMVRTRQGEEDIFPKIIEEWKMDAFSSLPTSSWKEMFEKAEKDMQS